MDKVFPSLFRYFFKAICLACIDKSIKKKKQNTYIFKQFEHLFGFHFNLKNAGWRGVSIVLKQRNEDFFLT